MKNYRSPGYRDVSAADIKSAAEIFAGRAARKAYGRKAYARTCNLESWSQDGTLGEFNAFIGYRTGPSETTGHNVRFTVYLNS